MRPFAAFANRRVLEFVAAGLFAVGAAILALTLFLGATHVKIALIGAFVLAFGFAICGNVRLGLLWALVFTVPLGISKRFFLEPNMGGAQGIQIEASDLFLFPLAFLILREFHLGLRKRSSFVFPAAARWWLVLIALGLLTVFLGPYRRMAGYELIRMAKLLLLLLVIANEVARRRQFRDVCAVLVVSLIIQSSVGIAQYILQRPVGLEAIGEASVDEIDRLSKGTLQTREFVYRVSAIMGHANLFATFIAALLPFCLALLFTRAPLRLRALCMIGLAMGSVALIMTLSRTGWLSAAVTLTSVMLLTLFHPRLRVQFPLGRVAFVVGAIAIGVGFSGKIGARILRSDEGAVNVRWDLLEVAWKMGSSAPVFGTGLNSFVFRMAPFTDFGSDEGVKARWGKHIPVVHNVYALVWAEMGAAGLIVFVGFCVSLLLLGIRCLKAADEEAYAIGAAGLMAFVAYMMDWLASFSLRVDNMGRVFFVLIGLLAAVDRWRTAMARPSAPLPRPADQAAAPPTNEPALAH